ncbi:acyl-CoA dehydrogenase [Gordonia alkanivorans]|uniref:acyl-CoA dehydrogenase n=1 Tax=Gordonia alkanivorans TaxID=84096 RepID=UPI00244A352D|nr:acyl-CoA dehydrogenase [Gordonia alkanivorans]MDH3047271.1 acyl-CoA dehydrogenase [Gordonia alkanivorans]
MALALSTEHVELAAVGAAHLARHDARGAARAATTGGSDDAAFGPSEDRAGSDRAGFWKQSSELGWFGLHLDTELGGSGFGLPELAVLLETMGHEVAPGPFLPTVAASAILAAEGGDQVKKAYFPDLADGSLVGAVGTGGGLTLSGETLDGRVAAVLSAPEAQILVLFAGGDVVVLTPDDPGVTVEASDGLDATRSIGSVTCEHVEVPTARILRGAARNARSVFRILASAEAVGTSIACLEMATEYAQVREQFGRTIGTFQAVKHHCANMLIDSETAVAATWDAARGGSVGESFFAAAVAASYAGSAALRNARMSIQLLGGIGFTWEHDAHLFLRRATTMAALLADGADPLSDVVAAYRSGEGHGATFDLPDDADAFRIDARAVAERALGLSGPEQRQYLLESGYLVPHWPRPWGRAAGAIEQLVIEEEFAKIDLPDLGIAGWVTLTIAEVGTDEQKRRWVTPVLRGDELWCQLFSEPGAGSDAAAVRTSAKRVDGGWRVTGQKVWTSLARDCQWGLATVRTDPAAAKHAGVTMMGIDLSSPGVQVRPLREITGDALFNEVFFDDVFVPDADVVGEVGQGWKVARATLGNERVSIGGGSGAIAFGVRELMQIFDNGPGTDDIEVGRMIAQAHALVLLNLRQASRAIIGAPAGPEANVTKLLRAEHSQRITELGVKLAGPAAVTGETPVLTYAYLFARCLTIAGGTSEIMRNTIAERILGLPRDPLVR